MFADLFALHHFSRILVRHHSSGDVNPECLSLFNLRGYAFADDQGEGPG